MGWRLAFGVLIESGGRGNVRVGCMIGAGLMVPAGIVELFLGIEAAGRNLEEIAKPITAEDAESEGRGLFPGPAPAPGGAR